jgi:serine/threonine-protein kinase
LCAAASIGSSYLLWHSRRLNKRIEDIKQLGQYQIEDKIGEGGMGFVYRARHSMLRRPTAIKLLRPEVVDEEMLVRFEREVQLTSELTHHNTVEVYDYGRTPQGIFYYAMEYIDGFTLADILESDSPIEDNRVVHITKQICYALIEAHENGIIHRDLKPLNIFICQRGGLYDVVKVIDFGLVKEYDLEPDDSNATQSLELRGTPIYIAPERLQDPSINTPQTDIYAIGVIMYNLMTGEQPYEASSSTGLIHQILTTQPLTFAHHKIKSCNPELEQLAIDCMHKDPKNRPESIRQINARLKAIAGITEWQQQDAKTWWDHKASSSIKN